MRYRLTSDELLILRDGRPFGEFGVYSGNSLSWPLPQTIAGMVRTSVGFSRNMDFFNNPSNAEKILEVGISKILPMVKISAVWKPLLPPPADLVLTRKENDYSTESENKLWVSQLSFKCIEDDSGTDISNREWMIPSSDLREKPVEEAPFFYHWDFYVKYIKGDLKKEIECSFEDIGISQPISDVRIHNAIDMSTYTTEEGKLFSNAGFYMKTKIAYELVDLGIDFSVTNAKSNMIPGEAYLGGERKRVVLTPTNNGFPAFPKYFTNKKFLKIVLITHGDFGGWCPNWLKPDLQSDSISWTTIPNTQFKIRLRSAVVRGWDSVSGWDYKTKKPKAMRKLVRPGSVYLIEIDDKVQSSDIANHLWGNSLNIEDASSKDGYGECLVGNVNIKDIK